MARRGDWWRRGTMAWAALVLGSVGLAAPSSASMRAASGPVRSSAFLREAAVSGGDVFDYGGAPALGSLAGKPLSAPIEGIGPTPSGQGYWLVAADGGIFAFGYAQFAGSPAGQPLALPVVGIARAGAGYWVTEGGLPGPVHASTRPVPRGSAPDHDVGRRGSQHRTGLHL
ncbi:MAG: hypothetical protein ACRDYZ_03190 [Acidimicrobiales bacterium]